MTKLDGLLLSPITRPEDIKARVIDKAVGAKFLVNGMFWCPEKDCAMFQSWFQLADPILVMMDDELVMTFSESSECKTCDTTLLYLPTVTWLVWTSREAYDRLQSLPGSAPRF